MRWNPLTELRQQITYQRKLIRLLGLKDAIRFRVLTVWAGLSKNKSYSIFLHHPNLMYPVELRIHSTDAEVYGQVITNEEYKPILNFVTETIVDCGANIGLTSAYLLSQLPNARVVAIEPFAANAEMCRRNLAPYGERATIIQAAVWSHSTRLVLDHDEGNEWGVRVRPARPEEAGDIDGIDIASLGLSRIDILKVDIEGSEEELFAEGVERWLPTVSSVAIELHGEDCEIRFQKAMAGYQFVSSRSGELTICRDMSLIASVLILKSC